MKLTQRFSASLAYFLALSFSGCAEQRVPVPWQPNKAGIEAGFDPVLPKIEVDEALVAECVGEFQSAEGQEIRLNRAIGRAHAKFLIFDLVHEFDAAAVVYAVEKGKLKFKFRYHLPGARA
jgi:hypothetical protein